MTLSGMQEIACQQVLMEDGSVFSLQSSIFPRHIAAGLTPAILAERYLDHIRSCTATLIRPLVTEEGIDFRLFLGGISLISFLPPETVSAIATVLRIRGGMLVQRHRCDSGELRFGVEPVDEGVKISLLLSGYCPLILGGPAPSEFRFRLYRLTQALIHRKVTVGFLALLYRTLAGIPVRVRLDNVRVANGRPL